MTNVLFIVGLPGSGKTTFAKNISNGYRLIDDPVNFIKDVKPYLDENLIITDPSLCIESNRVSATNMIKSYNPYIKIDWLFFENDPESCILNASGRINKKVDNYIKTLSKVYKIPTGSTIVDVYKKV